MLSSGFLLCRILKRRIKTIRVIEMPSDVNEHSLKVREPQILKLFAALIFLFFFLVRFDI